MGLLESLGCGLTIEAATGGGVRRVRPSSRDRTRPSQREDHPRPRLWALAGVVAACAVRQRTPPPRCIDELASPVFSRLALSFGAHVEPAALVFLICRTTCRCSFVSTRFCVHRLNLAFALEVLTDGLFCFSIFDQRSGGLPQNGVMNETNRNLHSCSGVPIGGQLCLNLCL